MSELVAVIDDEPDILDLVSINLERASYRVRKFGNAESFFRFLNTDTPDLVILDLMLPDMDGLEVCKVLKKQDRLASIPIIMLTAKAEETEKILGLELGADDYVTKPFSPRELVARTRAVLRRKAPSTETKKITIADMVVIDLDKYEVEVEGAKVDLTSTEFRILQLLSSKKGRVFSRDKILQFLWGDDKIVIDRTVDVHIKHLRQKLGKAAQFVKNVRGIGYKLEE